MTLRVGIISVAWGVQAHLPAWRDGPGSRGRRHLHRGPGDGGSGRDDARRRDAVPDAQEMAWHPDIDVVDVGTRPSYRRDMCLGALAAGETRVHRYPVRRRPRRDTCPARRRCFPPRSRSPSSTPYSEHFGVFRFAEEVLADGTLGEVQSVVGRLELSLFAQPDLDVPLQLVPRRVVRRERAQQPRVPPAASHGAAGRAGHRSSRDVDRSTSTGGTSSTAPAGLDVEVADTAVAALRFESGPIGDAHRGLGRAWPHPASISRSPETVAGS